MKSSKTTQQVIIAIIITVILVVVVNFQQLKPMYISKVTPTLAPVTPTSETIAYPCYTVGDNEYRIDVNKSTYIGELLPHPKSSDQGTIYAGEVTIGITLGKNIFLNFQDGSFTQNSTIPGASCKTTHWMTAIATDSAKYIVTRADADTIVEPTPITEPEVTILSRDQLPTKTWPDLEQYYACNNEERKDPKTNYLWELSMPLSADTLLYASGPWTVAKESEGVFSLYSGNFNNVFEVRSDNYSVGTLAGAGVYRINFTTKVCENDWLYVILPEENSFDFPITVIFK